MGKRSLIFLALVVVSAAACGGDQSSPGPDPGGSASSKADDEHAGHGEATRYGAPASASDADRSIEVSAHDDLRYDPDSVSVEAGEVIRFVVTNEGKMAHEFVLGNDAAHGEHAEQMESEGHGEHERPGSISLDPGETAELTWHFPDAGEYSFACHLPGHYEAGMVGSISVR